LPASAVPIRVPEGAAARSDFWIKSVLSAVEGVQHRFVSIGRKFEDHAAADPAGQLEIPQELKLLSW